MSHWLPQADGSILGGATDRAVEWSGGAHDQLAAIGFVAFCRDMQLDPYWHSEDWQVVVCGDYIITVLLDRSTEHDQYDCTDPDERPVWFGAVRVMSGKPPIIHILGVSATQPLRGARTQLLSPVEWLRAFPIHHTPHPEAESEARRDHQPVNGVHADPRLSRSSRTTDRATS